LDHVQHTSSILITHAEAAVTSSFVSRRENEKSYPTLKEKKHGEPNSRQVTYPRTGFGKL
jgi:hypothetical protein